MRWMLIALVAMSGCAAIQKATNRNVTTSGQQRYDQQVQSWVGHDTEALVHAWGYPSRQFAAPSGNTVYAYESSATGRTPMYAQAQGNYAVVTGGNSVEYWCQTYFEVDGSRRVVTSSWRGNHCF